MWLHDTEMYSKRKSVRIPIDSDISTYHFTQFTVCIVTNSQAVSLDLKLKGKLLAL
jgi:hypothetical protein